MIFALAKISGLGKSAKRTRRNVPKMSQWLKIVPKLVTFVMLVQAMTGLMSRIAWISGQSGNVRLKLGNWDVKIGRLGIIAGNLADFVQFQCEINFFCKLFKLS